MPLFPTYYSKNINLVLSDNNLKAVTDLVSVTDKSKIVWCGGIAISQYLKEGEMADFQKLTDNDLDILVPDITDILVKDILKNFEITHIHDYRKKKADYHHETLPHDNFFVGLKHKQTGVKIHAFDYKPFDPIIINKIPFNDKEILFRSAEDQAVTKLLEITRIRGTSLYEIKNGPLLGFKYLLQLINLLTVCDIKTIQYIWHIHPTRIANGYEHDYLDALNATINFAINHENIIAKTAPKPVNVPDKVAGEERKSQYVCPECIFDYPGFTITKQK